MARPIKRGLSYFPLDTDLFADRKIRRLLDKYGCEGTTVYLSVLCEIYAAEGYFIPFSRNLCFDMAYLLHIDCARIEEVLTFCVEIELFNAEALEKHQVLSSEGIQKRYLEVAKRLKRRGDVEALTFEKAPEVISAKTGVISVKTGVITEETQVITDKTRVSGGNKYTKGKGNKIKLNKKETNKEETNFLNLNQESTYESKNQQFNSTNEDTKRQAELRRMREAATADQ
ncbi:MAG: DUF4373 domain-containing protein [Tannerellaceae bacterium]|nr:DUF4373 domain-containing protein [Tannerellaceae bacterium]